MTLGYSDPVDQEGELSLVFRRRGTAIFTLSFSFVPGRLCSLEDAHVLLITRIQGTKGCFEDIRMATRLMEDVSPANVLLACAAGIGLAADVTSLDPHHINIGSNNNALWHFFEALTHVNADAVRDGLVEPPAQLAQVLLMTNELMFVD